MNAICVFTNNMNKKIKGNVFLKKHKRVYK